MEFNYNNTNFPENIYNFLKNIPKNKILFEYQNIVYEYLKQPQNRGLLVFHSTGAGKTISSISIAEFFRKQNRDVIVLSSKSLKSNYIKEIKNYNKQNDTQISDDDLNHIIDQYKFVTSNASNMITQLQRTDNMTDKLLYEINKFNLDNRVIIVDEAHNLFNSIVNGSKNANEFYDLVMKSKNIKLVLLTGSPIINNFFEIVPALNMCAGYPVLPEYYSDFKNMFIDEKTNSVKNKIKLQSRILGLVSYYGPLFKEKYQPFIKSLLDTSQKKENFPLKLPVIIEKVPMSNIQNIEYILLRDEEKKEGSSFIGFGYNNKFGGKIIKETESSSTSYRIKTRQISNVLIPTEQLTIDNLNIYSPKMQKIYNNIIKFDKQLGLVYSSFLTSGIEFFAKVLNLYGYNEFNTENLKLNNDYKSYAFYSGNQTLEEKDKILNIFNDKKNIDGKNISILLISSAGSEGLDLKNIRHVHIMEPYWNYARIHQVESRAIRYKSHEDLPEKERNVSIFIYLSTYHEKYLKEQQDKLQDKITEAMDKKIKIKRKNLDIEKPTDIHIFENSIKSKELNDKILQILAEVSIECKLFNEDINFNCFTCKQTNEKLFYNDFHIDMEIPSKCQQQEKVTTKEVILNNVKYYYDIKNTKNIYYFDEKIDGYIKLNDQIIIEKINNILK